MGNVVEKTYEPSKIPPELPLRDSAPTFDPELGFEGPRKKRVAKLTDAELRALKIPKKHRDYCAHLLVPYFRCLRNNTPFIMFCKAELHAYKECEYEDYFLRMKEYERERRLRLKELKSAA